MISYCSVSWIIQYGLSSCDFSSWLTGWRSFHNGDIGKAAHQNVTWGAKSQNDEIKICRSYHLEWTLSVFFWPNLRPQPRAGHNRGLSLEERKFRKFLSILVYYLSLFGSQSKQIHVLLIILCCSHLVWILTCSSRPLLLPRLRPHWLHCHLQNCCSNYFSNNLPLACFPHKYFVFCALWGRRPNQTWSQDFNRF